MKISEKDQNLFFSIANEVVETQKFSFDALKERFDIDDNSLDNISSLLEREGIISPLLNDNTRDVLMSKDEFSLLFNQNHDIKPTNSVDNNVNANNKIVVVRPRLGFFGTLLVIIIILILLLFGRHYFVAYTIRTGNKDKVEKLVGWVKDGSYYKYYSPDGSMYSHCLINDNGSYYYLDDNGYMAVSRWVDFDGKLFYVNSEGKMERNKWVGEFYVGNNGNVLRNTITPDGYRVGIDGRYIEETKQAQNVVVEPPNVIIHSIETQMFVPSLIETTEVIQNSVATIEQAESIFAPTSPSSNMSNTIGNVSVKNNYAISNNSNYMERTYLSNGKLCSINVLMPTLVDKDGNEYVEFKEALLGEQDNIVTELFELAESSIEENDDKYRTTYKYISSISFTNPRIKTQDDYTIVINESGKCNWNNGKTSRVTLILDYYKTGNTMSYYIEE